MRVLLLGFLSQSSGRDGMRLAVLEGDVVADCTKVELRGRKS